MSDRLNLEQLPPGHPDRPDEGDIWTRLRASRQRLTEQGTRDFDMPLAGLIVRYRRHGIDTYRKSVEPTAEWERWAQLLLDHCDGFQEAGADTDLRDLDGAPLRYHTLAERLNVPADPDLGARGLVRDIFGGDENTLVKHAQRVDAWLGEALNDTEKRLAKGS